MFSNYWDYKYIRPDSCLNNIDINFDNGIKISQEEKEKMKILQDKFIKYKKSKKKKY